uniref:Secreted protein n=1 Tax=Caenorhabditis tropicalis TaxID=1561998 RepID=A0A1I7U4C3_9PELO
MSTPSRNRATVPQRGYVAAAAASAAISVHPPVRCRASTNSYRFHENSSSLVYSSLFILKLSGTELKRVLNS